MSGLVYLVRHGHHAELGNRLSGRSDIALSNQGAAQVTRLGDWFALRDLAAVHSSPRPRTRQTGAAIAGAAGVPLVIEPALDEIDFGAWTGMAFADLAGDPAWRRWNEARDTAMPPEGEGMAAATERAWRAIIALAAAAFGPIAAVSHGDIIRGVVARVLGLSLGRLLAFDVDPGSVTTLSVGNWGGRLVALNERVA